MNDTKWTTYKKLKQCFSTREFNMLAVGEYYENDANIFITKIKLQKFILLHIWMVSVSNLSQ